MTTKVKKSVAGNLQALQEHWYEWLLPIAKRICRGAPEIDHKDLVHEAVVRFLEKYQPLEQPGTVTLDAWLISVMAHFFYDECKKSRTRQKSEEDPTVTRWTLSQNAVPPTYERITRERFDQAIAQLPEQQRLTFLLRSEGLRNQEIALKLRISVNVVAKRLFDARKNLRDLLQRYVDEEMP